ncbi:Bifunctional epoxide hydrolase 2 [Lachnellula arida]|uniref:Bifunctional epoxide hydrolase 2 n=1 Tax=Lachnellula arida TaxID=1316785 RepID=A0A8T9BF29_9HELO|nr:Bifunctional epoxide hydrolase 2 [Lachnellula arida]
MAEKLTPKDVQYKTAVLNGKTYSYILAEPQGKCLGTIFLVHGFPDMVGLFSYQKAVFLYRSCFPRPASSSLALFERLTFNYANSLGQAFGWRYQIPFLASLGLRVVAPDMMGYSGTDAPDSPTFYTFKRAADDLAALAKELGLSSIILGGHDWGGAVVYRTALRYPKLISAFFSVSTPYFPLRKEYAPLTARPNFNYQIQFASGEVEKHVVGEEKLGQLLSGIFGGRTPSGETLFNPNIGIVYDNLPRVGPSPLLSKEELDFYVKRYAIHGIHAPLNWYRTDELNFNDEIELAAKSEEALKFQMPALFIAGAKEQALPPSLAVGMEKSFRSLTRGEVNCGHWGLWEKKDEINQYLQEFLFGQVGLVRASL